MTEGQEYDDDVDNEEVNEEVNDRGKIETEIQTTTRINLITTRTGSDKTSQTLTFFKKITFCFNTFCY